MQHKNLIIMFKNGKKKGGEQEVTTTSKTHTEIPAKN
jgi:hypothetical protein